VLWLVSGNAARMPEFLGKAVRWLDLLWRLLAEVVVGEEEEELLRL